MRAPSRPMRVRVRTGIKAGPGAGSGGIYLNHNQSARRR